MKTFTFEPKLFSFIDVILSVQLHDSYGSKTKKEIINAYVIKQKVKF